MITDEAREFCRGLMLYASGATYRFDREAYKRAAEVINKLCDLFDASKEKKREKESIPPAPPIKKKGVEKKAAAAAARACACESVHNFQPPTREEVKAYANRKLIPLRFVDYWYDCMETNYSPPWYDCVKQQFISSWRRSLLTYWNNAEKDKAWFRWNGEKLQAEAEMPKVYEEADWILCRERCKRFDEKRCRCPLMKIPPALRDAPLPPEECERFKRK